MQPDVLIPASLAVVGPALTYLLMRRKSSGQVKTTEAETLWASSETLYKKLLGMFQDLEERFTRQTAENAKCEKRNGELEARVLHLEAMGTAAELIAAAKIGAEDIIAKAKIAADAVLATAVVVKDAMP